MEHWLQTVVKTDQKANVAPLPPDKSHYGVISKSYLLTQINSLEAIITGILEHISVRSLQDFAMTRLSS